MNKGLLLVIGILLFSSGQLFSQMPTDISYQGIMTDSIGIFKPDGIYNIQFSLHATAEDQIPIWSETQDVSLKNGFMSTNLGEIVSFGKTINFDQQYFLGLKINGDGELLPRIKFSSVPYSFRSIWADTAEFAHSTVIDTVNFSHASTYSDTASFSLSANIDSVEFSNRSAVADTAYFALNGTQDSTWSKVENNLSYDEGNVGIGTSNPIEKLHVENGRVLIRDNQNSFLGLKIENLGGRSVFSMSGRASEENLHFNEVILADAVNSLNWGFLHNSLNQFQLYNRNELGVYSMPFIVDFDAPTNSVNINSAGNVGIGIKATDEYSLAVKGSIVAEEIIVKLSSNWPDYVFEDNYEIKSIEDLKLFIELNGHLPEIPSADEIVKKEFNLGELEVSLLKKIEELSIYIIQLNERIDKLEKIVNE